MKTVAITFTILSLLIGGVVVWCELKSTQANIIQLGTFIILTLTLVVLILYAYDTNVISRITKDRWDREGVLATTYNLALAESTSVGDAGRTVFQLNNPSPLVVRARVNFNFKVYDDEVSAGPLYDGREKWLVFPQQLSQGWFEVERLLNETGTSVSKMRSETSDENRKNQLSMALELEFSDELGTTRTLPRRRHYFDFQRWAWIPNLGESR